MCLKIVCLFIFSILGQISCMDDMEMLRIFNGDRATIEQFPHTVYINKHGKHHCGGSIISEDIILTAAHCFTNAKPSDFTISVGTSDCLEVIYEHKLEDFVVHDRFVENVLKNDIAIVKLKKPVKFGKNVQPVKLVKAGFFIPKGKIVRTAGCGTVDERGHSRNARKLLSATLKALSEEECSKVEPQFNGETLLCLRDDKEHQSVCHGDSGSGFIVDGNLAGVVSFGPKICGESPLSGATKVSMYIKWINDHIKQLNGKPATVAGSPPCDTPKEKDKEIIKKDNEIKNEIKYEKPKEFIKNKFDDDDDDDYQSSEFGFDHHFGPGHGQEKFKEMMQSIKKMMLKAKNMGMNEMKKSQDMMKFGAHAYAGAF